MTSRGPLTLCDSLAAPKQWKSGCVRTDYELRTDPLTWVTAREASTSKNKRDSVEIDDTSVVNCERMEKKTKASLAFFKPDHSSSSAPGPVACCTAQQNFACYTCPSQCDLCGNHSSAPIPLPTAPKKIDFCSEHPCNLCGKCNDESDNLVKCKAT